MTVLQVEWQADRDVYWIGVGGFMVRCVTALDLAWACLHFPILSPVPSVQRDRAWLWLMHETVKPMVWLSMPGHE